MEKLKIFIVCFTILGLLIISGCINDKTDEVDQDNQNRNDNGVITQDEFILISYNLTIKKNNVGNYSLSIIEPIGWENFSKIITFSNGKDEITEIQQENETRLYVQSSENITLLANENIYYPENFMIITEKNNTVRIYANFSTMGSLYIEYHIIYNQVIKTDDVVQYGQGTDWYIFGTAKNGISYLNMEKMHDEIIND